MSRHSRAIGQSETQSAEQAGSREHIYQSTMSQKSNNAFDIDFLDHVAIRVKDLDLSVQWYAEVLGLKKMQLHHWGPYPIFMLAGKTGIALFPIQKQEIANPQVTATRCVDHFAFQVTLENYKKAKAKFKGIGISYKEQDHHYLHSIYIQDPDNHTVELTTLVVEPKQFYEGLIS